MEYDIIETKTMELKRFGWGINNSIEMEIKLNIGSRLQAKL